MEQDIDALIEDLKCDDVIKCQKARRTLVATGHEAVPHLVEALRSKKNWAHWEAAKALSQIGDPAATSALIETLEDDEFGLRWLAAEGLIYIGKPAVKPLLQALINKPNSILLKKGVHHILFDMNRGDLDEILRPVMTALDRYEQNIEVPVAAEQALEKMS
jgi:HEAT repeat protein